MPETAILPLRLGYSVIRSYKRLSYRPWTALAEFVDNSTESYRLNRRVLNKAFSAKNGALTVSIEYDRQAQTLEVSDDAMGMSLQELTHALEIGARPLASTGR